MCAAQSKLSPIYSTCIEYVHPWTDHCTVATAEVLLQAAQESFRIYSAVYAVRKFINFNEFWVKFWLNSTKSKPFLVKLTQGMIHCPTDEMASAHRKTFSNQLVWISTRITNGWCKWNDVLISTTSTLEIHQFNRWFDKVAKSRTMSKFHRNFICVLLTCSSPINCVENFNSIVIHSDPIFHLNN